MINKCIWFLGLSGAGKTTLSEELAKELGKGGQQVVVLDGDVLRTGLNSNLGFSDSDRVENVRRTAEVAKLFLAQGFWVIVALITPLESMRKSNRAILGEDYFEVFVDTPLAICQERDPKGLYAKVRQEGLRNFTGIDSPFDSPLNADLWIKTEHVSAKSSVQFILGKLTVE
ncbi:adenylyl-sulfate kinase [Aquirufa sp. ROCK-SH2]